MEKLCDTYLNAPRHAAQGAHVISVDDKTGMQGLERLHPTKPVRLGLVERVEFEYVRHGTLCLMANFDVVTGRVVSPSIGPTRTAAILDVGRRLGVLANEPYDVGRELLIRTVSMLIAMARRSTDSPR